ncbi:hypothetical protein A2721_02265 [Candidatus Gottesmanbacteria bacterium RIFCSPHIGHO2_01_FULL_47_48]|uniref:Uncharacterized protein n=1 Tax=Candidatus Gottesmanbacteria bacterium RIFCSPHIGHO2_01_FULL_47_48 TaxID=1798381 RepID=A0A1F5ZZP5_9BACT|nr:MAG: hypothetical protein A2721_02265 [Candidatus Gottesmanbacteria bacterium RIFCSPHIGHO2_01_FULL_47_48]
MEFFKTRKNRNALLAVLSGVCQNLAAGWFAAVFLAPDLSFLIRFSSSAIVLMVISLILETKKK